jgi:hypothetical protein
VLRLPIHSYCKERSVKDRRSTPLLGSLASMWAGPTALKAPADLEANVAPEVPVEADKDLADPVEAAEEFLAEGAVGLAAVQEVAQAVRAHLAAEGADVFFASR